MRDRLKLLRLWLSIGFVACAVLLYTCVMPSPPQPAGMPFFDKIEHFLAFLVLGTWFAGILPRRYVHVFIGLFLFALAIELIQGLIAYRDGDVLDLVADSAGIVVGIGLARIGVMRWLDTIDRHVFANRNHV